MQFVESRNIDPGQGLPQIFAGPFETSFGETGEDRARRRQMSASWVAGKRHHEAEEPQGLVGMHTHEAPPQKQPRGVGTTKGTLKAARSATRTHHELVARVPRKESMTIPRRRDAAEEKLATPSAQGIYHRPFPGPSIQLGWVVGAVDGER
jgi:hypothetical protein